MLQKLASVYVVRGISFQVSYNTKYSKGTFLYC